MAALAKEYDLHPSQIATWKKVFLSNAAAVFEKEGKKKKKTDEYKQQSIQTLNTQFRKLKEAHEFLKKNVSRASLSELRNLIDKGHPQLSVVRQCDLLGVNRSSLYYKPVPESEENLQIMRILDEQYLKTPFYGVERLLLLLADRRYKVNRKRLRRLMRLQGWQTIYPAPRTNREDSS